MPTTRTLHFDTPRSLDQLYGGKDDNLRLAENVLGVSLVARDGWMRVEGEPAAVEKTERLFNLLQESRRQGIKTRDSDFAHLLRDIARGKDADFEEMIRDPVMVDLHRKTIVPKTLGQKRYLRHISAAEIVFGIGPAGTGKTYLAMAMAVSALLKNEVKRLVLSRPAVEAGEALGFLPGDLREKILPYLRPVYDALYDMIPREDVARMIDKGIIEIAPLAYMRGRTLSDAFIILDEAQNTTPEQMLMFLTRLGDNSRMVITGDITQIDLPRRQRSGLVEAPKILGKVEGVRFFQFTADDVVRHPLVLRIIEAYEHQREAASGAEE
jgi:phosphate starvation-inducible protein PhoH and related proteins